MARRIASDSYYEARLLDCEPSDVTSAASAQWMEVQDEEGESITADNYDDCLAAALEVVDEAERKYLVIAQVDVTYFVE